MRLLVVGVALVPGLLVLLVFKILSFLRWMLFHLIGILLSGVPFTVICGTIMFHPSNGEFSRV
jgi:hypothetical protein